MPLRLRTKLWLESSSKAGLGPGNLRLLALVAEHGTLAEAARAADMSYRHAWDLVRAAEACWGRPLLERRPGGAGGGRSALTADGRDLLARWDRLATEVTALADERFKAIFPEDAAEQP